MISIPDMHTHSQFSHDSECVIEAMLLSQIEKGTNGKAFEINTSSFGTLGDFMPTRDIIRKYYAFGGRIITVGLDAHVSENASANFDEALDFIKKVGFENVYYFKDRKPCAIGVGI